MPPTSSTGRPREAPEVTWSHHAGGVPVQPGGEQTAEGGRNHGSPAFLMGVAVALGLLVVLTLLLA